MNYTYILQCSDGTYYTGWTNRLEERIKAHNLGKGAKYTRGRLPAELVYFEIFETKEEAMRREAAIKQLSRKEKQLLIERRNCKTACVHEKAATADSECPLYKKRSDGR